jgi:hypothetical protein
MVNGRGSRVSETKTDFYGRYELKLPKGTETAILFLPGLTHESGEYYFARPNNQYVDAQPAPRSHRHWPEIQHMKIENVVADLADVDWKLDPNQ